MLWEISPKLSGKNRQYREMGHKKKLSFHLNHPIYLFIRQGGQIWNFEEKTKQISNVILESVVVVEISLLAEASRW